LRAACRLHGIAAPTAASFVAGWACWFAESDLAADFDSADAAAGFNPPDAGVGLDSPEVAAGFDSSDGASGFGASALMATSAACAVGCVAARAVGKGFALGADCEVLMSPTVTAVSCDSAVPAAKQPSAPATIKTDLRRRRPPCRTGAAAGLRGIVRVETVREVP